MVQIKATTAIDDIWEILHGLRSPRDAAKALAGAHVMLLEAEGVRTEADARVRVQQSSQAVLNIWRERAGLISEQ